MTIKTNLIAKVTGISIKQITNTLKLFDGGATIPFISRYRKESTGGLNEEQIEQIKKQDEYFTEIIARKETILKVIEKQGNLTDKLKTIIDSTWDSKKLEDIYNEIDKMEKTRVEVTSYRNAAELFYMWAATGLFLLLLEMLLSRTYLRKLP